MEKSQPSLDEFFRNRAHDITQKLRTMTRKESDKIAVEIGISVDTMRRLRCNANKENGPLPSFKVLSRLEKYIDNM